MPNPRRLTHSRGTSWEITYRVDRRMVRQRFETRVLAVNALARARAAGPERAGDHARGRQDDAGGVRAALAGRPAVPAEHAGDVRQPRPQPHRADAGPPADGQPAPHRHQRLRRRPHPQAAGDRNGRHDLSGAGDDPALGRARPAARGQPLLQDQAARDATAPAAGAHRRPGRRPARARRAAGLRRPGARRRHGNAAGRGARAHAAAPAAVGP